MTAIISWLMQTKERAGLSIHIDCVACWSFILLFTNKFEQIDVLLY